MTSLAQTVTSLVARRAQLVRELTNVDRELNAVSKALGMPAGSGVNVSAESGPQATATPPSVPPASKVVAKKSKAKKATAKRAWFEKDEASKLVRRIAKKPLPVADVVREIAKTKGYEGRLSPADMRRFQGAAFMAVAQAVKSKTLRRNANGSVVAA